MRSDRRVIAAAVAALSIGACDVPTLETFGPAYDPTERTEGLLYHWPNGAAVAIYVSRVGEPEDADLERAVREAIAVWNAVGLLGEVKLRTTTDLHSADVIVHHAFAALPVTTADCEPGVGRGTIYTHFCIDAANRPIVFPISDGTGGRVKMLVSVNRGAVDSQDIFRANVAHELGHVVGIGGHSTVAEDLMFNAPRTLKPTAADAQTLRYVLGQTPDIRF